MFNGNKSLKAKNKFKFFADQIISIERQIGLFLKKCLSVELFSLIPQFKL